MYNIFHESVTNNLFEGKAEDDDNDDDDEEEYLRFFFYPSKQACREDHAPS